MMPLDDTAAFSQGMADPEGPSDEELADVKAWKKRVDEAREFDKHARKRYAIDRRYARGDCGSFEVGLPIAGSYVDILKSFLYANDPELDCEPSPATTPPPMADLLKMARDQVRADPQAIGQAQMAGDAAAQKLIGTVTAQAKVLATTAQATGQPPDTSSLMPGGQLPPDPHDVAAQAGQEALEQAAKAKAEELMAPYRERQSDAKQLGQTLECVVAYLWKCGRLKSTAEPQVGSGMTVGVGWMKACWMERTGDDPVIRKQMNDLQDNLARLLATQEEYAEGDCPDPDATRAEIQQQLDALEAKVEVVIARGLAIDFVSAEDIQVAPGVPTIAGYREAPWIAHRTFMSLDDAKALFPAVCDQLTKATIYKQREPMDPVALRDIGPMADVSERDADSYRTGMNGNDKAENICVWEVWNKLADTVLTLIEGLDRYARAPYQPKPGTKRFYPFFLYAPVTVDGERHPQSMIQRTQALLDDMNRIYSNRAEHRRRCIPKTGFDATNLEPAEAKKIEGGGVGEMIAIRPTIPGTPINTMFSEIAYPQIDAALYDDGPTRAMLEMAWGIQEALSSTIRTAKTATEAEIQQTGTQARTSYMRDALDEMLNDLADYTAEISLQMMTRDDVMKIAGPWAFWPEGITVENLSTLVMVNIRAGSSGKPDTTAQRQAWATVMPIIQNAIIQIGQLRGSSPEDIADCVEELVAETLQRTGDKIDAARFLPSAPDNGGTSPLSPAGPPPASTQVPAGATLQ